MGPGATDLGTSAGLHSTGPVAAALSVLLDVVEEP